MSDEIEIDKIVEQLAEEERALRASAPERMIKALVMRLESQGTKLTPEQIASIRKRIVIL